MNIFMRLCVDVRCFMVMDKVAKHVKVSPLSWTCYHHSKLYVLGWLNIHHLILSKIVVVFTKFLRKENFHGIVSWLKVKSESFKKVLRLHLKGFARYVWLSHQKNGNMKILFMQILFARLLIILEGNS